MNILKCSIFLLIFSNLAFAQTVDGGFTTSFNGSNYEVMIYAKMQSGTGTAGVVELEFSFNELGLSFPASPVENTDYVLQGDFASYITTNITKPASNKVGINLVTIGTPPAVPLSTSNTNILKIIFTIDNTQLNSNLQWTITNIAPEFLQPIYTAGNWVGTNEPLPVELSLFEYQLLDSKVKLIWETASEVNNYGFDVERATLNADSIKNWGKIGFVEGNGTSNSPKTYEFNDVELPKTLIAWYRLKQIDIDGTYDYSKSLEVDLSTITGIENEIPVEYSLSQNYPNPFNPSTKIKYSIPYKSDVRLKLYNVIGEEVKTLVNEKLEAGNYSFTLKADNLASGVYIYRITAKQEGGSNYIETKKLILLK